MEFKLCAVIQLQNIFQMNQARLIFRWKSCDSVSNMPYWLCDKFHKFSVPNKEDIADCSFLHYEMINYEVMNSIAVHFMLIFRKTILSYYHLFSEIWTSELHTLTTAWRILMIHNHSLAFLKHLQSLRGLLVKAKGQDINLCVKLMQSSWYTGCPKKFLSMIWYLLETTAFTRSAFIPYECS